MVEHFNRELLSPQGFMVHINDRNITLPDGEKVENGLDFRNNFHLHQNSGPTSLFPAVDGQRQSI